jgi:hypothetical protein
MGQGTLRGRGGRLVRGSDAVQGSALCPHWGRAAPSKDHVQGTIVFKLVFVIIHVKY